MSGPVDVSDHLRDAVVEKQREINSLLVDRAILTKKCDEIAQLWRCVDEAYLKRGRESDLLFMELQRIKLQAVEALELTRRVMAMPNATKTAEQIELLGKVEGVLAKTVQA